jgi:hypothetical protein
MQCRKTEGAAGDRSTQPRIRRCFPRSLMIGLMIMWIGSR